MTNGNIYIAAKDCFADIHTNEVLEPPVAIDVHIFLSDEALHSIMSYEPKIWK